MQHCSLLRQSAKRKVDVICAMYGIHFVTIEQFVFRAAYYTNFILRRLTRPRTMLFFGVFSCDFRVPSPCRDTKCEMTRWLTAKVASAVRQRFVKSSSMATFKRVSQRVISAAAPLGKATGFCVSREAPLAGLSTKCFEEPDSSCKYLAYIRPQGLFPLIPDP